MRLPAHLGTRLLMVLAAALWAAVIVPAVAGSEATPTVEAVNKSSTVHQWVPEHLSVGTGGAVTIKNATTVPHGVHWNTGPGVPSCSSVPGTGGGQPEFGTEWSGSCTFTKAGTYTYFCTVHGTAMSGSVTVGGPPPVVKKLSPRKGRAGTMTTITITGSGFTGATAVAFGATAAASFMVNSDSSITALSPVEPAGTVDVRVSGPGGTSAPSRQDRFKFVKHK